jgi:hypothetical protein
MNCARIGLAKTSYARAANARLGHGYPAQARLGKDKFSKVEQEGRYSQKQGKHKMN